MQEVHKGANLGPDSYCRKLYPIICLSNIILNFDNGILPAATVEIMQDLDVDEIKYGLLGSIIYLGLVGGSLLAGVFFQKYPAKNILSFCTFMMMISLSVFTFTKDMNALVFARISCGFFQVFLVIYFPVWVDIYGKGKRTIWLTYLQVGVPLGIFLGYAVTAVASSYISWKFSFWIQIVFMFPTLLVFLFCSEVYIDTKVYTRKYSQGLSQELEYVMDQSMSSNLEDLYVPGQFTIETSEKNIILPQDEALLNTESRQVNEIKEPLITIKHISIFDAIKVLWNSKVYLYSMLSICSLDFIVTGIQFWLSDYLRNIMDLEKTVVFATYSLLSITGPTIGVIVGGYIVDKKGGYKSKNALPICGIFAVLASLTAAPVPFVDIYWIMVVLLWFLLFFGGALMPAATGIMISAVPRDYRAFANSAAQTFANLFGYLPSPFLYGMVLKFTGGQKSRWGMCMLMFWSFWGLIGLLLAFRADRQKRAFFERKIKQVSTSSPDKKAGHGNKSSDFLDQIPKEIEIVQPKANAEDGTPFNSRIFNKMDKFSLSNEFIPKNEYSLEGDRIFNSERLRYSLDISRSPFVSQHERKLKMGDMSQSSSLQGSTYQITSKHLKKVSSPVFRGRHSSLFNFNLSPNIIQNIPLPEKFRAKRRSPEKEAERLEQRMLFQSSRENIMERWKSDRQNIQEEDEKANANDSSQISDNVKGIKTNK